MKEAVRESICGERPSSLGKAEVGGWDGWCVVTIAFITWRYYGVCFTHPLPVLFLYPENDLGLQMLIPQKCNKKLTNTNQNRAWFCFNSFI